MCYTGYVCSLCEGEVASSMTVPRPAQTVQKASTLEESHRGFAGRISVIVNLTSYHIPDPHLILTFRPLLFTCATPRQRCQELLKMKTAYLTQLTTSFNPFSMTSRVPRLFLTNLPPNAHRVMQIKNVLLPKESKAPAVLELGFKDGKKMRYEWSEEDVRKHAPGSPEAKKQNKVASLKNVIEEVDRHARMTARKDELKG